MEPETNTSLPVITLDDLIGDLDKNYSLTYVDYRDNLDERSKELQSFIHGDQDALCDIYDAYDDNAADAVRDIIKELQKETESHHDLEEGALDQLFEEHDDALRDAISERDDSDLLGDLIRNTSDPAMFYDTGHWIDGWPEQLSERLMQVKKGLKIAQKNKEFDKDLTEMCAMASYGGRLVIYFNGDLKDWIKWGESVDKRTRIKFTNHISVAICDHNGGSGGDCTIDHEITLPYNRENVFIDKTIKYNYTYAVCGMHRTWCDGTRYEFESKKTKATIERSRINNHLDIEAEYNATFKAGGCTNGDTDIRRHRKAEYVNEYPCGNRCHDCGMFWID